MSANNSQERQPISMEEFEDILVYFSKSFIGQDTEEDILWDLAKNCISKLGFVDCVIYLIDHENGCLIQKAAYGPKNPKDKSVYNPVRIDLGYGISGTVAMTGEAEMIHDTSKDPRYIVDDEVRLSEITVPISTDEMVYGVIDCEHPEKDFFTSQHLKMLTAIASICAIKINKVRADKLLMEKQENLLKIKQEMIELKLKAFNSQMNPHFVFNALNAIQFFITSGNKKSALGYFSVFSKLIRFYLKHLDKETVGLKDEIAMLNAYLVLQKLRYNDQFEYEIETEDKKEGGEACIPSFILQTLFENIIEEITCNQYPNCVMKTVFSVESDAVLVDISYTYDSGMVTGRKYTPEYRERMIQWQDQINLLNTAKGYGIEKKIFMKESAGLKSESIVLRLPNLS